MKLTGPWKTTTKYTAIVSAIILFIQALAPLFGFEFAEARAEGIMTAVNAFLFILVQVGILTNLNTTKK